MSDTSSLKLNIQQDVNMNISVVRQHWGEVNCNLILSSWGVALARCVAGDQH